MIVADLIEITAELATKTAQPMSESAARLIADARRRMGDIDCFDFVPSNYELAWATLSRLPPSRFCELGSGLGVTVGLAELLGHRASGVELDAALSEQSRGLLRDHNLSADVLTASYFDDWVPADIYYVYSWPSQLSAVQQRFIEAAPPAALLLICFGQDDIRCLVRRVDQSSVAKLLAETLIRSVNRSQ